jgi:hypothetical protein
MIKVEALDYTILGSRILEQSLKYDQSRLIQSKLNILSG